MFKNRIARIVLPTAGATLAAAGIAFAAGQGSSSGSAAGQSAQQVPPPLAAAGQAPGPGNASRQTPPPPPPGGPGAPGGPGEHGDLAYGELHVVQNGNEKTVRLDRGKVDKVSSSEVTITEANDDQVTIAVDDSTEVHAGPGQSADVGDIQQGDQVMVERASGDDAADSIGICPDPGQRPRLPAPPSSQGQSGGAQQAPSGSTS